MPPGCTTTPSTSAAPRGEVLTASEVADLVGAKRATIYQLGREGKLPAFRVGRLMRFRRADLDAWMADGGTTDRIA